MTVEVSDRSRLLGALLDHIDEGVLVTDASGRVDMINKVATQLLNLSESDPLTHLSKITSAALYRSLFQAALAAGDRDALSRVREGTIHFDIRVEGAVERILDVRASALRIGETWWRLIVLRDVTELRCIQAKVGKIEGVGLIDNDPKMRLIIDQVMQVAATEAFVLLQGESGTGKGMVARLIHENSKRSKGPFVVVNCAAIPESLMETEFFGHVKGAFTGAIQDRQGRFEKANGGTLFLDEISELSLSMQAKMLRVLQDLTYESVGSSKSHTANVRIICAANISLRDAIDNRRFRADLYYRLNVFSITIPPLRERIGDIPLLFQHFLTTLASRGYRQRFIVTEPVMALLLRYPWPGNVRELQNVVEHAVICARGDQIVVESLPRDLQRYADDRESDADERVATAVSHDAMRGQIRLALRRAQGNRSRAAKMLGIDRVTLWRRMRRFELS